jgi:galactose mutarotase-like enzyme
MPASSTDILLATPALHVRCSPAHGFAIRSIVDRASGVDALWQRAGHVPAPCSRDLGPAGAASEARFLDLFAGGWFAMFPEVGYPLEGDPTSFVHGEAVRLPWEVVAQGPRFVEARVDCVRRPLALTRRLTVDGAALVINERVENTGRAPAPYTWGHHPCFARAAFAGGRVELEVTAAEVPAPWFDPAHATLAPGPFSWPHAAARVPARAGFARTDAPLDASLDAREPTTAAAHEVDLSEIPASPDGRHDHACLTLASGRFRLTAPAARRALRVELDRERFPYALLWQCFGAGDGYPFWGRADTFAVELATCPGRSTPDALAAGAVATLAPGETAETEITVAWEAL